MRDWMAARLAAWAAKLSTTEQSPLTNAQWQSVKEQLAAASLALRKAHDVMKTATDAPASTLKRDLAVLQGLTVDLRQQLMLLGVRAGAPFDDPVTEEPPETGGPSNRRARHGG